MTEDHRDCALYEPLLSGALDQQLTQQQQQLLEHHLRRCEYCSAKLAELEQQSLALRAAAGNANAFVLPQLPARKTPIWQWLGWLLMLLGTLVIAGWMAYQYAQDALLPLWLKLAVGAVYLGLAVLFIGVVWQRKQQAKTDRYKRVQL